MSWIECECGNTECLIDSYIGRIYKGPCFKCFREMSKEEQEKVLKQPLESRVKGTPENW